jgi:arylsulfatase A-like enzyme
MRPQLAVVVALAALAPIVGLTACKGQQNSEPTKAKDARVVDASAVAVPADAAGPTAPSVDAAAPATARVEHPVWNLVDNRALAHRIVDGDLVISASDPSFVRYAGFGLPLRRWKLGRVVDGVAVAVPAGGASLSIPLSGDQLNANSLTIRAVGTAGTSVTFKLAGQPIAKAIMVEGFQTFTLPVPAGRLQLGENQLVVETRAAATPRKARKEKANDTPAAVAPPAFAIDWLRFSSEKVTDNEPASLVKWDGTANSLELRRAGAGVAWFVSIPEGANLVADVSGAKPECAAEVRATVADGSFVGGNLQGKQARLDLTKYAGQVVRLTVTARECEAVTLSHAAVTLHGAEPQTAKSAPPKYIVLWVMDAMRADRIPAFTPGARAQTPNFDELSKTGAAFRQYYVQGNESQTSHSSVWTSLYPAVHNVRMAGVGGTYKIDKRFNILGAEMTGAGLVASGTTGNGFVNADGGYNRGFTEFRNMMREKGIINGIIYGEQIVDVALKRLDALRKDPTFLFLGTIDTHGPWIARKPWIDIYSPGPYHGPFQEFGTAKDLGFRPGSMGCAIIPPPQDVERLRAIYDSAISYIDNQLGRFVTQLKTWGIWDETMLIVTADHGEELFEDRRCGHGGSLRDTLTRVPLLIHYPAMIPGGAVDEGADGVDILPTMLDALGKPLFENAQGMSLLPLANGVGRGWVRPSYTSMYEYAHTMRLGRWKIRVPRVGEPFVHDFKEDPTELKDFARERPFERRMLTDALAMFLATRTSWKKSHWGVVTNLTAEGATALDAAASLDSGWR